jgi:hypothetical protein
MQTLTYPFHLMVDPLFQVDGKNIWRPSGARCGLGTVSRDCIPGSGMLTLRVIPRHSVRRNVHDGLPGTFDTLPETSLYDGGSPG